MYKLESIYIMLSKQRNSTVQTSCRVLMSIKRIYHPYMVVIQTDAYTWRFYFRPNYAWLQENS